MYCYSCGFSGHFRRDCPNKNNNTRARWQAPRQPGNTSGNHINPPKTVFPRRQKGFRWAKKYRSKESSSGPKHEEIMERILFKCSDFVAVQFKDMDSSCTRRDAFTDSAISAKVNGEHKEKDLEPWDAGELTTSEELEALENDVSNGWDPNDMFRYNEEHYGVVSTYDSSLSSYTVPLERDNSEEFLKREARANQLAEEIESSAQYKAWVALENDDRSEEEKYTAVQRNSSERESHSINTRKNKCFP